MTIRWLLEPHMKRRKWTAYRLAKEAGLTPSTIYKLLKNEEVRIIEVSTLEALCGALACQPEDVLDYKP